MMIIKLKPLIVFFFSICVLAFGMEGSESFAACPDGNDNCDITGEFQINSKRALKMSESYSAIMGGWVLRDIFIGEYSGALNPDANGRATGNVFIGRKTGSLLEIGGANTFLGDRAAEKLQYSHHNTYIGAVAGGLATSDPSLPPSLIEESPSYNTAVGFAAGSNSIASCNVFLGAEAGESVTIGKNNILIGKSAGDGHERPGPKSAIVTGSNNIFIGQDTEAAREDISSSIAIGTLVHVEDDHQMVVGGGRFYSRCDQSGCVETVTCTPGGGVICDFYDRAINESYWGSGVKAVDPQPFSFNASGGQGDNVTGGDLIIAGGKSTGIANGGSIKFQTSPKGSTSGSSENQLLDRMVITAKGRVGIGVTNPNDSLHINGGTGFVTLQNTGERGIHFAGANIDPNDPYLWVSSAEPQTIRFWTANGDRVVIKSNGNVGIGTTSPQGSLDVNGSIYQRGSELYADYVFKPTYKLESIEEHSKYMWSNKHLKAMPKAKTDDSGKEIVEVGSHRKGIVEELEKAHIYIDQLHERLKVLEGKLAKLENN